MLRLNAEGNPVWSKELTLNPFIPTPYSLTSSIEVNSLGEIYVHYSGTDNSVFNSPLFIRTLTKLSENGDILFSKSINIPNIYHSVFNDISISNTGELVLCVENRATEFSPYPYKGVSLIKFNNVGEIIGKNSYHRLLKISSFTSINNGYMLGGIASLIKTDSNGYAGECNRINCNITIENYLWEEVTDIDIIEDYPIALLIEQNFTPSNTEISLVDDCDIPPKDGSISILNHEACSQSIELNIEVCNNALGIINGGLPIAVYSSNPLLFEAELIGQFTLENPIQKDSCFQLTLEVFPSGTISELFVVINDFGTSPRPYNFINGLEDFLFIECNYENNMASLSINPFIPLTLDLGLDSTFCSSIDFEINAQNGFESYLWQDNSDAQTYQANAVGIYSLSVLDACGNIQQDTIEVEMFVAAESLNLGENQSICGNGVITLTSNEPYPNYLWQDDSTTPSFSAWLPGLYWLEVTDECGNVYRDSVEIALDNSFSIDLGEDIILCQGEEYSLSANPIFETYQWTPSEGLSCDTCSEVNIQAEETTTYRLVASNSQGCYAVDSILISVSQINNNLPTDTIFCSEDIPNLSINPNYSTYQWFPSSSVSCESCPDIEITINQSQIIYLEITDELNCTSTDSISIIFPEMQVDWTTQEPSCFGEANGSINLFSEEAINYSLNGQNWQTESLFDNIAAGEYFLLAEDENACIFEFNILVTQPEELVLNTSEDINIFQGEDISISTEVSGGTPDYIYTWSPSESLDCTNCPNIIASPSSSTPYIILVQDNQECLIMDTIHVSVFEDKNVFIPSAFSPNGDGFNDEFVIYGSPNLVNIDYVQIFDYWGELIFEAKDILPNEEATSWNGMHRGEYLVSQVLVYQTKVTFQDGSSKSFSGDVTLLR